MQESSISLCMTPAGVKYVQCLYDSCRSHVSRMTPAGVKYVV